MSSAPLIAFVGLFGGRTEDGTTEELLAVFAECLKKADAKLDPNTDLLAESPVSISDDLFIEALEVFERLSPKEYGERYQAVNKTVGSMIDLYAFMKKNEQVERLYKRQMELATKVKLIDLDFEEMFDIITRYAQFCVFKEDWRTAQKLLSQKVEFVKHVEKQKIAPQLTVNLYAEAYNQLGFVEMSQGNLKNAINTFNKGVEIIEKNVMSFNQTTTNDLFSLSGYLHLNIATAYRRQEDYEKALDHYDIAHGYVTSVLSVTKAAEKSGKKSAALLRIDILQQMAQVYLKQKDFDKGLVKMKEALQDVVKLYGAKSETTRDMYISLGNMNMELARYEEAGNIFSQALKLQQGSGMHDEGKVYVKLGQLSQRTGNLSEARENYNKALKKHTDEYGENSIEVGAVYNNLGTLATELDDEDQAEQYYQKALAIADKGGEALFSFRALVSGNLASIYTSKGKYNEAEKMFLEALELKKKLYGEAHNQVATSYNNLGYLYQSQKRINKAEECFQKALEIVEKVYDPNHREIATVLMNLGIVKNAYNKPEEAKALFERALSIYKATFGPNPRTSETANIYRSLGVYHATKNEHAQAEEFFSKAHDILAETMGADRLETIKVRTLFADTIYRQGDYTRAIKIYEDAREALLQSGRNDVSTHVTLLESRVNRCRERLQEQEKK
jgi:tetratricopeptide (TPR) repeat protein